MHNKISAEAKMASFVPASKHLPWVNLLVIAMTGFITILTEILPAGLLPLMGKDLAVSEALIGQLITLYAIGSLVAAIPIVLVTQTWRRRPLLLTAILGFTLVNVVTAISPFYSLALVARFFAGVFAGLFWALSAGYAIRMVTEPLQGRAIAVAMVGTPLALALGVPVGAFLGALIGWRYMFLFVSLLTLLLAGFVCLKMPDFAGQPKDKINTLRGVFIMPGIRSVLLVILLFILAHYILYTYIAPFLSRADMLMQIDKVLLTFGLAALLGIWIIGVLIDRWLRELVLISILLFISIVLVLGMWGEQPTVIYAAVAIWGLSFGGAATLFQTACAKAAGESADMAQSMVVTTWNTGIAGGGLVGGILLTTQGVGSFAWVMIGILLVTLYIAWNARVHGFPKTKR